jgi:hypothetical protein
MKTLFTLLLLLPLSFSVVLAQPTGTLNGLVLDAATGIPLPGATVVLLYSDPLLGTSTASDGTFTLARIPVGRRTFRASYIGFEPFDFREIMVTSGKDVLLTFRLKESVQVGEEIVVSPPTQKERAINDMALVSVRQISMEEASRFAGGFDDPARLASAMAGAAGGMGQNSISVRGNAPKNILWRLEGVEIDNPSHFANITSFGGGGITALSAQLVANSDFYTGAFPAEYGNVVAGIFDIRMREGNRNRRSYTLQVGGIGLDASAEGPFDQSKGTYLANYRYSTLALLTPVLPEDAAGTRYQDLSFKFRWQDAKLGTFSLWGLGAADISGQTADKSVNTWRYNQDREEGDTRQGMGAIGLSHALITGKNAVLENRLTYSGNYIDWNLNRLDSALVFHPQSVVQQQTRKLTLQSTLNLRLASGSWQTGVILNRRFYDVTLAEAPATSQPLVYAADASGHLDHVQAFTQFRRALAPNLEAVTGAHSQYNAMSGELTFEPRAGLRWTARPDIAFNLGFGRHSQLEMPGIYALQTVENGVTTQPNRNLRMTKADHFVLGAEWKTTPVWRLRLEPYFQMLTDVPTAQNGTFTTLNLERDWFITAPLTNRGKARNLGIDFTAERFLQNNWYFLATGSLFRSRFTAGGDRWFPTRFDKGYVANVLGGYEWNLRGESKRFLSLNGRLNFMGGNRISAVDETASAAAGDVVYDASSPFSSRAPRIFYADASMVLRTNHRGYATLFTIQLNNALAAKEWYGHRWNLAQQRVETHQELLMVPNISWKIEW